jgi:hypothetical protein
MAQTPNNRRMDKLTLVYSFYGLQLINKKEQTTDKHNTETFQKYSIEWKKLYLKEFIHIVKYHLYKVLYSQYNQKWGKKQKSGDLLMVHG